MANGDWTQDPTAFDLQLKTPTDRFREYATRFAQPYQQAFSQRYRPLTTRYSLQEPTYGGDFGDFLESYGARGDFAPMTMEDMRSRAQAIAGLTSIQTPAAFQEFLTDPGQSAFAQVPYLDQTRGLTPQQMATFRQTYGGAESGQAVQDLVNLMMIQRPTIPGVPATTPGTGEPARSGGQYNPYVQNAIGRMVDQLYNAYMAQSEENVPSGFLEWYLRRPGGAGQGFAGTAA